MEARMLSALDPTAVNDSDSSVGVPETSADQKKINAKGKAKAVILQEHGVQHEPLLDPYTDEQPTNTRKRSPRQKRQPAHVTLLQTTLRSSQFEKAGKQMHLPLSGHWAIEIRGEVFELNRMESWTWSYISLGSSGELDYPRWVGKGFAIAYLAVCQKLGAFFQLRPQAGSRAQIDSCSHQEYLALREKWTEPLRLGTTTVRQKCIKRHIAKQNEAVVRFYSIFSNNCQHFILDLCETIELQPHGMSNSTDAEAGSEVYTEFARDYWPNNEEEQDTNLRKLLIKSRIVFLIGSLLYFLFSFMLPFITILVSRWGDASVNKPILLVLLVVPYYGLVSWLSFADIIVGHEDLPLTMNGSPYLHSTCYTGPHIRRLILASPNGDTLVRFLLRMEKLPHKLYLLLGYLCAIPVVLAQLGVPGLNLYLSTHLSLQERQVWALMQIMFHLLFVLGHGYDMVLQNRKLRQGNQAHAREEVMERLEDESLEEHVDLPSLLNQETKEQNPLGESSRS